MTVTYQTTLSKEVLAWMGPGIGADFPVRVTHQTGYSFYQCLYYLSFSQN